MKSLSLNQPHMIIMVGILGSGKTFFAKQFAETFHAPYVSYEKINTYVSENDAAAAILRCQLEELLKTRQSIIVDGSADTRSERADLAKLARQAGYQPLFLWVQTDPATAKARALKEAKNNGQPLTADEYDKIVRRFTAPNALEKPVVISGKHTYATQAKVLLKKLSAPRAEISTHSTAPVRMEESGRRNITIR